MFQEITIQFTEQCNIACPYCFAPIKSNHILTYENFKIFEEFCEKNRPDVIHITGGEPALNPLFGEFAGRLEKISSLVIYSNLTVKDMMERIETNDPSRLVFLANTNSRYFCSEDERKNIRNNMDSALLKGFRVALSHTFYSGTDSIETEFDYLTDKLEQYGLRQLRVSQALECFDRSMGLDRNMIGKLYHYVAENVSSWKTAGWDVYFDCPVPPCYIDGGDFKTLWDNHAIQIKCLPKVFVMWNLDVTHCYSTMKENNKKKLNSFVNLDAAREYSRTVLREKQRKSSREGCCTCGYGKDGIPCGCPSYCV